MVDKTGLAFLVCVLSGLVGCAGIAEPKVQSVPLNADSLFSSTGALNTSTVQRAGSDFVVCMGPGADVAFDQSDSSNISISLISRGSDSDGLTNTASEVELTGRTPSLLMARELLYRTCEFSKNFQLSKKEATQLFIETLKGVVGVWRIESGNTKVRIGDRLIIGADQSVTEQVKVRDSRSQESDLRQSISSSNGSSNIRSQGANARQNAPFGTSSENIYR